MAVKRDYGVFSTAASRQLKPLVEQLGYRKLKGACFVRERDNWIEGFFLQQSAYGGGDFWANVGLSIPKLDDLWQNDPSNRCFGLTIGARLDKQGIHGSAQSYSADNALELKASLEQLARDLQSADPWFAQFRSMTDVAEAYKTSNNLCTGDEKEHLSSISIINYGFLLLLAGNKTESRHWLEKALRYWQRVVLDNEAKASRRRPGKETLGFFEEDLKRLNAVKCVLREQF